MLRFRIKINLQLVSLVINDHLVLTANPLRANKSLVLILMARVRRD